MNKNMGLQMGLVGTYSFCINLEKKHITILTDICESIFIYIYKKYLYACMHASRHMREAPKIISPNCFSGNDNK